ncbi:MAG TPA: hypothetical protein DCQ06_08030, partial [Myxococcales bacterium]|nr:hypothetical protein [Myxococcales bacterium]
ATDCGRDGWCNPAERPQGCEPIRCRLHQQADARRISSKSRGVIISPCTGDSCRLKTPCSYGTYCAPDTPATLLGFCERPVPVVVNPLLMEIFNSDMADSLNLPRVADPQLLYGQRFHIAFGDSHFTEDAGTSRQQIKQAVVVGFSTLAPELGVALPLRLVRHHNRRIRGTQRVAAFDAVWVQTDRNERTAEVIKEAEAMGLSLSRRSRFARTLGRAVYVLYVAMLLLGLLVLSVSASNITQTLAMLVHERRAEIAILRALGGASWDVAGVILAQGAVLGVVGSTLGVLCALAVGEILERLIQWLQVPLLPEQLLVYPIWLIPIALTIGLAFCLLGAILPARRAIRLDPSEVLSQP